MLKILECPLSRLQNEEHYKFHTDTNGLITIFTAATLLIVAEYNVYLKAYADEGEALHFVRKSTYSDQLHVADMKRNETLHGIDDVINSGLKHFNTMVREASTRLKVMSETIGNITGKSQQNKTGAIIKLISDFRGPYKADITTVGLDGWVDELVANNTEHDTIENSRLDEKDAKTDLRMKEVRVDIDARYRTITDKINALIIVNGEAPYVDFVNKLNLRIDSYSNNLSIRKGKSKKSTDPAAAIQ